MAHSAHPANTALIGRWGTNHEIESGLLRACITSVGACLRTLEHNHQPLVAGFSPALIPRGYNGAVLAPWPNRVARGTYRLGDQVHRLPINEPARRSALHGLVHRMPWEVTEHAATSVSLATTLAPTTGYPFTLDLFVEYSLGSKGLSVTTSATNRGDAKAPVGLGHHPYFATQAPLERGELQLPASAILVTNDRGIPDGRQLFVAGTEFDFRRRRAVGAQQLDTCFSALDRDADGMARVRWWPARGVPVTVWMDEAYAWVMLYTADTLAARLRRRSIAIEPMTCAPDAFNNGLGLRLLAPDETLRARWGVAPHPASPYGTAAPRAT